MRGHRFASHPSIVAIPRFCAVFRSDVILDCERRQLIAVKPEQSQETVVRKHETARNIIYDDCISDVFYHSPEALLALTKRQFRLLSIRDIGYDTYRS